MGEVKVEKVGFGDLPLVYLMVTHPAETGAMVPIARQVVYMALEAAGIPSECIEMTPTVQSGKRRKFTDQNPSSASHGKNKFGIVQRFGFAIKQPANRRNVFMDYFEWDGRYGKLPDRRES